MFAVEVIGAQREVVRVLRGSPPRTPREYGADGIAELAGRGLDLKAFWDESAEVLSTVVPYFKVPCWFTLDPASLLVTSHYDHALIPELPAEWLAHEYYEDDVHDIAGVARSQQGISTLHEAAGGDPSRSPRWQANMQVGGDQELLLALRTPTSEAWGLLGLYREPGRAQFHTGELEFLCGVAPHLPRGARRGLLVGEASEPEGPEPPGLVVLKGDWTVDPLTPGAERWLCELPNGDWEGQSRLPPSVLAVAGRALRTAERGGAPAEIAVSRVLSIEGRWMILHGAASKAPASRPTLYTPASFAQTSEGKTRPGSSQ